MDCNSDCRMLGLVKALQKVVSRVEVARRSTEMESVSASVDHTAPSSEGPFGEIKG
jgi:hypothetical protein